MLQVVKNLWNARIAEATFTDTTVTGDIFVTADPETRSRTYTDLFVFALLTMLRSNPRLLIVV